MKDDLEQIRARLRELGYLRNPVERFVVGGGGTPGRAGLWGAALRCWVVLGGLWSAWGALALVQANAAYLVDFGEGLLLALYCFLPGLVVSAAAFALLTLALQLAGSRPRSQRRASILRIGWAALGALVFGGSAAAWWLTGRVFVVEAAPTLVSLLFLAAAVGLGLLAYRLCSLVAGFYLGGRWLMKRRLREILFFGAGLAVLALVAVLARLDEDEAAVDYTLAPGPPVLCLAVDYLDPAAVDETTPTLRGLRAASLVYGLEFEPGVSPAQSWATLVTGRPPRRHGITELSSLAVTGIHSPLQLRGDGLGLGGLYSAFWRLIGLAGRMPVTSRDWREPPLWELVAGAPGNAAASVFNWWATYPARGVAGLQIFTDVAQAAVGGGAEPPPGSIFPADWSAVPQRPPRLLLQLLNGRERARRLGVEVPPPAAVEAAVTEVLANYRGLAAGIGEDPVVVVVLKPGAGGDGELWLSRLDGPPPPTETRCLDLYDAAALLFTLCGVPLAEDLPGEPPAVSGLIEDEPRRVAGYGPYRLPALEPGSIDAALESLRSLGYLQ
jgi:hypothetical protein